VRAAAGVKAASAVPVVRAVPVARAAARAKAVAVVPAAKAAKGAPGGARIPAPPLCERFGDCAEEICTDLGEAGRPGAVAACQTACATNPSFAPVAGGTETCNDLVAFGRQTLDATFGDLCPADPDNPPELPECALFGANIAECFVARCPATEPTEDILARAYASFCNQAVAGGTLNPADAGALGAVGCDHPVISEIVAEQVAEQGAFCEEGPSTDPEVCAVACMEVGPCIPADGEGAALRDPDLCISSAPPTRPLGPEAWACVAEGGQCQEIIACLQNQPPPVVDVPECGPFASKVVDCIEVSCPTASALEAGLTDLGRSICNQAVAEGGGNVESLMGIADATCDDPRIAPTSPTSPSTPPNRPTTAAW
jgi:hypothetical protein